MPLQFQQGGGRPVRKREGIHVEGSTESCSGRRCHLPLGFIAHGAFTENGRHLPLANRVYQPCHAFGCDLAFGIHRPEIGLFESVIRCQISEGPLTTHQQPLPGRQRGNRRAQLLIQGLELGFVGRRVSGKDLGSGRIELAEGPLQMVHVAHRALGGHPGMGIGLAGIGVLRDQQRVHPLRKGDGGHISRCSRETLGPQLQPQPVLNNQIRLACALDVTRGGLVTVDLGTGLDDRSHLQPITRHVAGQIGENREGGEHLGT